MLLELGFVMNLEKSMLTPAQDTIFLGFSLDCDFHRTALTA